MIKFKAFARCILGLFFIIAGFGHFYMPEFYLRMMPAYLPLPYFLIYLSGLCEIAIGVCCFIQSKYKIAKWGAIALLIAVFPANIHMAMHPELFPEFPDYGLWIRLPFQAVFIVWVLFSFSNSDSELLKKSRLI